MKVPHQATRAFFVSLGLLILSTGSVLGQDIQVPLTEAELPAQPETPREKQVRLLAEQAIADLARDTANGSVHVVRVSAEGRPAVYLEYDLGWIRFVDRVRVRPTIETSAEDAESRLRTEIARRAPARALLRPIISRERASEALQACHASLQVVEIPPRPPWFNNRTNILWKPEKDYLALRSDAVIDRQSNHCARAFVDLRTAEVKCFPVVACEVY